MLSSLFAHVSPVSLVSSARSNWAFPRVGAPVISRLTRAQPPAPASLGGRYSLQRPRGEMGEKLGQDQETVNITLNIVWDIMICCWGRGQF